MNQTFRKNGKHIYRKKSFILSLSGLNVLMAGLLLLNIVIIRSSENTRAMSEGQMRLTTITSEVESSLNEASYMVDSMARMVERLLSDGEPDQGQLRDFVEEQTRYVQEETDGNCFSAYIAYKEELYIVDFIPDSSWILEERTWYTGARKHQGDIYFTSPYIDANTGKMCYSVSKLLSDGETVVSIDLYMDHIQSFIEEMNEQDGGISLIVNETGMIVGHSDPTFVGQDYSNLPYGDIVKKVFSLYGDSFTYTSEEQRYDVFSDKTSNNWYLIICVDGGDIAATVSTQLYWIIALILLLAGSLIAIYVFSYRTKALMAESLEEEKGKMKSVLAAYQSFTVKLQNQIYMAGDENWAENNSLDSIRSLVGEMSERLEEEAFAVKGRDGSQEEERKENLGKSQKRSFQIVVSVLIMVGLVSLGINTFAQLGWGHTRMESETKDYYYLTKEWVTENRKLVNTLAQAFTAQPELVDDYDACIAYLNDMVKDYPDVSVAYIVNPEWPHPVMMNNGWESDDPTWKVEERQWYLETMDSENENGFNISSPYMDEQTGYYCVTLSQIVYDKMGDQIGVLGVDYYMDKLIDILGESYSDTGYAFLVDMDYNILNHPNQDYQMTAESFNNAGDLCYREVLVSDQAVLVKDYDGVHRLCMKQEEETSGFSVIVAKSWMSMYGTMVFSDLLIVLVFVLCVVAIIVTMQRVERMQAQANHELRLTADSANAANKAKGDFLANMSHEIRTPINAVLGMNEMILRESEDKEILEYARNIQSAGRTLLNLINTILDFSKIEDGKMEIVCVEYDIASLINDLVHMIMDKVEKKNLALSLNIDPKLPKTLFGDDIRVRQIITNLLTNAVKYTPEGTVTLSITFQDASQPGNILLNVEVRDTGIGIKEEDMDKLFQSFQRLDMEKNRSIEGTGLGISIVQRLLSLMGSQLEVHSVYGQGSAFSFSLQQGVASSEPIGDYKARLEDALEARNTEMYLYAPAAKVLIVDDYQLNLKVAKGLLKRCGIVPDTALSGQACLEQVREHQYDVIFLDHMMPEMDGIETLDALRKGNLLPPNTKIIMMTANAIAGAREGYIKAGFDDYLAKPIDVAELERKLKKYLPPEMVSFRSEEDHKAGHAAPAETGTKQEPAAPAPASSGKAPQQQVLIEEPDEEEGDEDAFTEGEIAQIKALVPGLAVEDGLAYCMNSKEFYLDTIRDYIEENREEELGGFLSDEDTKNYAISVHSLKGATRMIGLKELASEAEALQKAAEKDDLSFLQEHHPAFIQQYSSVKEALQQILIL